MNIKSQEKLIRMLFESGDNPVVTTEEDRFHLEDCIQYATKPGIIVATIKGDSESGIQQLPIGAVDSFRFMKVMDENAIINQEKNNGRSYDSILKEYEGQKNQIIQQWKKANLRKLEEVKAKYGNKFLGMDIVENQKQIQHKEEEIEDGKEEGENVFKDNVKTQDIKETDNGKKEQVVEGDMKSWFQNLVNNTKNLDVLYKNPLTKKTTEKFISACEKLGQGNYENTTLNVSDPYDNKIYPITNGSFKENEGNRYLVLVYQKDDSKTAQTLSQLNDFLVSEIRKNEIKGEKLIKIIQGILVIPYEKQDDNDNYDKLNISPIVDININGKEMIFKLDKNKNQKNTDNLRKTLFTR